MLICIKIILSELYLQVCQIYKYHYCNDIFLSMNISFSVYFSSHLSRLGHHVLHLLGWDFVFEQFIYPDCVAGD